MGDPKAVLERARLVAARVEPPADSFDRFIRYRTRRERNRRVATAMLGLAIASAGIAGGLGIVVSLHRGGAGVRPGPSSPIGDSGARRGLRVLNEVRVGSGTFRVVRYRDGRGLYCQDIDFSFSRTGRIASAGGCNDHPVRPLSGVINASWGFAGGPPTNPLAQGEEFAYVYGEIRSGVASVRVHWSDGGVTIARPQNEGFLDARAGPAYPTTVTALGGDGRVLGRKKLGSDCGILGGGFCDQGVLKPGSHPRPLPSNDRAALGVPYSFDLYTHCGILWANFDGRYWAADPPLTDGNGNPPAGWGNPTDHGTMELVSPNEALYRSDSGMTARFSPGRDPPGCA
jgi:hypothetical protein